MRVRSVSAAPCAIEGGDEKPVKVSVEMNNSAGVFQLDRLFREKLSGSGLENYLELEATVDGDEKPLVSTFRV